MRLGFPILFLLLLFSGWVNAQQATEVFGRIIDVESKQPLEYVNIRMVGTLKATLSDFKGEFRLRTTEKIDSISFSYLGYKTRTVKIKRGISQEMTVEMGSDDLLLTEITVKAGKKRKREIDTTANYVFYQVLKHKEQNRSNSLSSYSYQNYDKFQISLLNPGPKFLNFFLFRPFSFAFENKDTTEEGGMFIRGVIKETLTDVYYTSEPVEKTRTFTVAEKMTGIDNPSVYNLVHVEFRENDPYNDMYYFARTYFNAPFAPIGMGIYYYHLTDTQKIDGRVSYKLHFVGKAKEDLALKGFAWIDSATWAIRYIQYRPNEKANLNFVNEYDAKVDYTRIDDKYWFKTREEMHSVGSLFKKSKKKLSILFTKLDVRKNIRINEAFPDSINSYVEEKILLDSARARSPDYWDSMRYVPLEPTEKRVLEIADTFKLVPAWQAYQWAGVFFTTAYADAGPISFGRVLNFISRNNVEGWRARFGFETCPRFQKRGTPANNFLRKFYFGLYGAYGFKDKDWKYQAITRINLPWKNEKWQQLEIMYRYDIRVPGQDESQTLVTFDNIFSLISGQTLSKVMKVNEFNIHYEKDWLKDFSTIIGFHEKTFFDVPGVSNFAHPENNQLIPVEKFNVTEFMLDTRYSYKSVYTFGSFYRYWATTKYPAVLLRYTLGIGNVRNDNFNYHNLLLTIKGRLFSPIGFTNYIVKGGKIFGRVPYTAAYLTQGNLGFLLDKYNYNLLREFEFLTDQYAQLWLEHHFNGFIFNKIPGFNKLKLREVLIFKGLIGTWNQKNAGLLTVPSELSAPFKKPYIELGFGIENILYLFRVDFLWRATYRNSGGQNWGVKLILQPSF